MHEVRRRRTRTSMSATQCPAGFLEWGAGGRIVFNSYRDGWQHLYSLSEAGGEALLLTPPHPAQG